MAERRMFAKTIIDSDAFLDMPHTTQLLYFHLSMRADDDGFINNPRSIMRNAKCSESDLQMLAQKKFIIPFESGVVVIKHWKIHNYIRNDRYKETKYKEEKATLALDENNAYTQSFFIEENERYPLGIPNDNQMDTQDRLGKDRLGKDNIINMSDSDESEQPAPPKKSKPVKHKYGEYKNVLLTDDELDKLKAEYSDWQERIERLSSYVASTGKSYKSHYATIRNWARKDAERPQSQQIRRNGYNSAPQRQYDMDAMEKMLLESQNPTDDTGDPAFMEAAEALQRKLQEKYAKSV